jgi:hypothetical protein
MGLFRRAGAEILKILQVSSDPTAVAGQVSVYGKNSGGSTKLFMRNGAGTVTEVGSGGGGGNGIFSPPEMWVQPNVPANQAATPLSSQVSGSNNAIRMARAGSIVGLSTRLTEAITAGSLTVTITKNGTPVTLSLIHTSGTGSQTTQAAGIDTYVAGDLIGIQYATNSGFLPITTDLDAWIEVSESLVPGVMDSTLTYIFDGTSSALAAVFRNAAEVATVSATAATGTIAYDITTQSVLFYTANAAANWTVNLRASSGSTLDSVLSTGQSITVAFLVTQGGTAFFNSAVQVDGTTVGVTTRWQGGTAPSAGNINSVDVYSYTVIKTGAATFSVLASQTRFA